MGKYYSSHNNFRLKGPGDPHLLMFKIYKFYSFGWVEAEIL